MVFYTGSEACYRIRVGAWETVTYTEQHYYVSVIGDAYSTAEKWQFGFRLRNGPDAIDVVAEAMATTISNWFTDVGATANVDQMRFSNAHRLTELKIAKIDTNGLYLDGTESYSHFYATPPTGTVAPLAGELPQNSVAVTLLTAKPRGLASRGRIFLPPSALYAPGTDGRLTVAGATQLATGVKRLINNINTLTNVTSVAVFSKGKGVAAYDATHKRVTYTYPNAGATENVTGVGVGRVVDTVRRRRRQLVENRQEVVL